MFRRRANAHQEPENESQQQQAKINELKAAIGPLSGRSSMYCSDACYKRYLEARNWNVEKAKKMLKDTLEWRSSYKPEEIRWPEIAHEGETGKIFRASFCDRQGRSVLILRPGMQNTKSFEDQIRHLVYLLENAVLNLPEDQEKMSILIDYTGWSITNKVPIKTAHETISILQNHYPERLAVAFFYSPPRIFQAFWKVVKYFLDPRTIEKVKFVYPKNQESVEVMRAFFDDHNLPAVFGGESNLEYDHAEFSKLMLQDDVKTASFWGFDQQLQPPVVTNGHHTHGTEVGPET
ncbi:Phosphatidylinositol transfer protein 3 [Linum perenne]